MKGVLHRCLTTTDTKEDRSVIRTGRREEEDAKEADRERGKRDTDLHVKGSFLKGNY